MAYVVHRRRVGREERHEEAAVQRTVAKAAGVPEAAVVDLSALHRSLAAKEKAIPILVAFAHELMGTEVSDAASPPPSSGEAFPRRSPGMASSYEAGGVTGDNELPLSDDPPLSDQPLPEPDLNVTIVDQGGMLTVIDKATGLPADSATTWKALGRRMHWNSS